MGKQAQRGEVTCLRPHSQSVAELGLALRCVGPHQLPLPLPSPVWPWAASDSPTRMVPTLSWEGWGPRGLVWLRMKVAGSESSPGSCDPSGLSSLGLQWTGWGSPQGRKRKAFGGGGGSECGKKSSGVRGPSFYFLLSVDGCER